MINKNDILDVRIEDTGTEGEGVAKVDGYTLFVKDAIAGDHARIKVIKALKNYGYGRLEEIISPSPFRVEAVCPVAKSCGGCQIQEMSYAAQLDFKRNKVENNLIRIGKLEDITVLPVIGMDEPFHYRNKAQFPVGLDKDGNIVMGFYAGRTHNIIECDNCAIGLSVNSKILNIIKEYMINNHILPYNEATGTGVVRHILIRAGFKSGEIMVSLIINDEKLPNTHQLVDELLKIHGMTSISYNINKERTNKILGKDVINLYGEGYITDFIGDVKFKISPLSFYQVNPVQTEKLYGKALEFAELTGNETVWDLYCGVGTISLFLAKKAKKVYGVEIIPEAIKDACENARINSIENSDFFVGKSEEVLPDFYKKYGEKADVIVVDPPRKGCDINLLKTISDMAPDRLVYVSCDSATLARDLNYLTNNGFKVEKVQPVDMFPMSSHVETVVALHRTDS